jgi:hypothetical protein
MKSGGCFLGVDAEPRVTLGGKIVMKYLAMVLAASSAFVGATNAQAQAPDFSSSVQSSDGSIMGGGHRLFVAGGSEMLIVDAQPGGGAGAVASPGQAGRLAVIDNHGDGPQVRYLAPAPRSLGRHARIYGGGNEQVIVYGEASHPQPTRR